MGGPHHFYVNGDLLPLLSGSLRTALLYKMVAKPITDPVITQVVAIAPPFCVSQMLDFEKQ